MTKQEALQAWANAIADLQNVVNDTNPPPQDPSDPQAQGSSQIRTLINSLSEIEVLPAEIENKMNNFIQALDLYGQKYIETSPTYSE